MISPGDIVTTEGIWLLDTMRNNDDVSARVWGANFGEYVLVIAVDESICHERGLFILAKFGPVWVKDNHYVRKVS